MIARCEHVTYTYPAGAGRALEDVSLEISQGSFTLLAGPSASGKSTFLRLLNGLVPQFHGGELAGRVEVAGLDPAHTPARRMATVAGMVFQEPEAQAIADRVEDDVAFGMEQQGVSAAEMRCRLEALLPALGIDHLRHRLISTLSGGERQRVAIASVLVLEPSLLLLDEPTSQLDPSGADAVLGAVARLHQARELTILCSEHRLERLLPAADHVLRFENGAVHPLSPRTAAAVLPGAPAVCQLGKRLGFDPLPLTVEEAQLTLTKVGTWLVGGGRREEGRGRRDEGGGPQSSVLLRAPGDELVRVEGLTVAYGEEIALNDATFTIREGEVVALVGANGSGKTTLFRAISGLVSPATGTVALARRSARSSVQERTAVAGLVPQDPAMALSKETVVEEVAETLRHRRLGGRPQLDAWEVRTLAHRNPRDLSVGQQQRVAIAAMLAHEPRVWLLDEPTRGADYRAKAWLAARLRGHACRGGAAMVATHDIETAARFATRVIGLEDGHVAFDLPARRAFAADGPLPTQVARLVPGAILVEEVEA